MELIIVERERHIIPDDLRAVFPEHKIQAFKTAAEAVPHAADAEALIGLAHNLSDELIRAMPKLKYICSLSAGVDHLWTCKNLKESVRITNGRGIHGPQMAELGFLFMIGLSRNYLRMEENRSQQVWERWGQPVLVGKTALIVGIGAISEALAARCKAFEMRVVGVSDARTQSPGFDEIVPRARLLEAAAKCDFMIVLVPLDERTHHMINADVFKAMKPSSFLINLARGDVIDEAAMLAALKSGQIAGAGLDVFHQEPLPKDHPFWGMKNVMMSPRIGGMSDIYDQQIMPVVTHNIRCLAEGRMDAMRNIVR